MDSPLEEPRTPSSDLKACMNFKCKWSSFVLKFQSIISEKMLCQLCSRLFSHLVCELSSQLNFFTRFESRDRWTNATVYSISSWTSSFLHKKTQYITIWLAVTIIIILVVDMSLRCVVIQANFTGYGPFTLRNPISSPKEVE